MNLTEVEIISECCSYPLLSGRCSKCWEGVVGVPLPPDSMGPVEREQLMQDYYRENGIDFDDKYTNEPSELDLANENSQL